MHVDDVSSKNATHFFYSAADIPAQQNLLKLRKFKESGIPKMPKNWVRKPGWHRYDTKTKEDPVAVDFPPEECIVFDVEKLYKISPYATMATAVSAEYWYSWCSKYICDGEDSDDVRDMIPLNPNNTDKLVVGHNVGYDRATVLDEYAVSRDNSNTFYIDTISIFHYGYSFHMKEKPSINLTIEKFQEEFYEGNKCPKEDLYRLHSYRQTTLKALYKRYAHKDLPKELRCSFDSTDKQIVINKFEELMTYCAHDVEATYTLLQVFLPKLEKRLVHPSQFMAMKELGNSKFYISQQKWTDYNKTTDEEVLNSTIESEKALHSLAKQKSLELTTDYKPKSVQAAAALDITFRGKYPVVNNPPDEGLSLKISLPNGKIVHGPLPGYRSRILTVLQNDYDVFWKTGLLTADNRETQTVVSNYLRSKFWNATAKIRNEQFIYPLKGDLCQVLPLVKVFFSEYLKPNEYFWLQDPLPNSYGIPKEQAIVYPEGYTSVQLIFDVDDWFKEIILKQRDVEMVSPYLIREAFEKMNIEYIHNLICGIQSAFKTIEIEDYHLMTSFDRELRYIVKEKDSERAQVALDIVEYWAKSMICQQTFATLQHDNYKQLVEDSKILKGYPAVKFKFITSDKKPFQFTRFKRLYPVQLYLNESQSRGVAKPKTMI